VSAYACADPRLPPVKRVLVTGGAGFVGGSLCVGLAERNPDWTFVALDNLRRRGSELNLPRLAQAGVAFVHGDVRAPEDLSGLGPVDIVIECSAEPSVMAGVTDSPDDVIRSNLFGAFHCLELARRHDAQLIFLSTSRVYPIAGLEGLRLREAETRFELESDQSLPGASDAGIAEDFPLDGARTLYGASKLSAEHLITEYIATYGLSATVLRCGVIAGPWQMGKPDQGVFSHWLLSHYFGRPLAYMGYGGSGKQVRDLLHVDDLLELIEEQMRHPDHWAGTTFNVGGGRAGSLSLLETTALCRELTGHQVPVRPQAQRRAGDVPVYLTDCRRLFAHTVWRPSRGPEAVLSDLLTWVTEHGRQLRAVLR
jgi:CDP-paratose 2-epimerase